MIQLQTERLILRKWTDADLIAFACLNADPEVMAHFPTTLSKRQSDHLANKIRQDMQSRGWGFWALCAKNDADQAFLGFVGLNQPTIDLPCNPCVEIGWRLCRDAWGKGYATEAARACLTFAFHRLQFDEVYSFTSTTNLRSQAVMHRLGMTDTQQNFIPPHVPESSPLKEHVLYKINSLKWSLS